MHKKINNLFALVLAIAMGFSISNPVIADDGDTTGSADFSNFFDSEGNLLEGVTDGGEVEVDAEWMNSGGANGMELSSPAATFHVYIAENGDTLLAPSFSTTMAMIGNPDTSGILDANGSYQTALASLISTWERGQTEYGPGAQMLDSNGNIITTTNTDVYEQQLESLLLEDLQKANAGRYSEGSTGFKKGFVFTLNFLINLFGTGADDEMLAMTYLYYTQDNCEKNPLGCEKLCEINPAACSGEFGSVAWDEEVPTYVAPSCPASTIVPGSPSLSISKTGPNYPLVVGQDPDKRGADVSFSVVVPPTVYTYYVPRPVYEDVEYCRSTGTSGNGRGVVANCKTSASSKKNNGVMVTETRLVRVDCEKHVLYYAEPISSINASANLTEDSINWIKNELSGYYYGATTQQTSFSIVPGMALANAHCDGNKTCYATGSASRIPFSDPGTFSLNLVARTSGTPVTTGRTFSTSSSLQVSFISVRLIENGSN